MRDEAQALRDEAQPLRDEAQAVSPETAPVDPTWPLDEAAAGAEAPVITTPADLLPAMPPSRRLRTGAMTARERIVALFDPGTFVEWAADVGPVPQLFGPVDVDAPGDGVVSGVGEIGGRPVFAFSQDFAVLEGTLGERGAQKIVTLLDRAADVGAPVIGLLHSNGARLTEGLGSLEGANDVFHRMVVYSGRMPIIAVVMGFCAGFSAYLASLSDLVIMVERTSFLVTTSPAVVQLATNQRVRLPELGGARMHAEVSGVCHMLAKDEADALRLARETLSYLDGGVLKRIVPPTEPMPTLPANPAMAYDVTPLLKAIADGSQLLEVWPRYARNVITAFARIDGRPVGLVANQPTVDAGAITPRSSRKMGLFVKLCNAFGLPLIFIVDVPGILPGVEPEREGILAEGAFFYKSIDTDVPRIALVTRKCYGGAYGLLQSKTGGGSLVLAYPMARIGVVGAAVAQQLLGTAIEDPAARAALSAAWTARGDSVEEAARRGIVDRIIQPARTRRELARVLALFPAEGPVSRLRSSGWAKGVRKGT